MPSKRTINDSDLTWYASQLDLAPPPMDYAGAGAILIAHFGVHGHDPFTRKDWDLVLEAFATATGTIEIPDSVKVANKTFERLSKGLTRPKWGYYSHRAPEAPETAPTAPQAPGASATPAESAPTELEAAMDALATDEPVVATKAPEPDLDAILDAAQEAYEDDLAHSFSQGLDKPPAPKPLVVLEAGVTWVPPGLEHKSHALYVEDEGLRRIAVSQTKCFGNFSDRAKACSGCPLAGFCAVASMSGLSDIEAALNRETEEAVALETARAEAEAKRLARANEPVETARAEVVAKVVTETEPPTPSETEPVLPPGATTISPPFDSKCTKCPDMVPKWSTAVHLPGEGIVHLACANK